MGVRFRELGTRCGYSYMIASYCSRYINLPGDDPHEVYVACTLRACLSRPSLPLYSGATCVLQAPREQVKVSIASLY